MILVGVCAVCDGPLAFDPVCAQAACPCGETVIPREFMVAAGGQLPVHDPPACPLCGCAKGAGTLLDAFRDCPRMDADALPGYEVRGRPEFGIGWAAPVEPGLWEEFAVRYRCPACAAGDRAAA